jgi:uncharacterized protein (TIGR02246 family)
MRFVLCALWVLSAAAAADTTQDLAALEQKLTDALFRSDADAVGALWADDLVWIGLNGKLSSKAEQLAGMRAPQTPSSVVAVTNKDVKVRLFDKSAVVTVRSTWTIRMPTGERAVDYVATHVWNEQRGGWRLVTAHISRASEF